MSKITYEDKQAIQNDDSIANKNKVTADDMNEIKKVVNENAEEIKEEAAEIKAENVRLRSDINSISLVGEAEGESIDLDDSSDARFLEFGLGGNHKQETREEQEGTTVQGSNVTINDTYISNKIQMEIDGNCEQGEDPTPINPQNIEIIDGINLLPLTTKVTQTINGVTFVINDDGTIVATGTATAKTTLYLGNTVSLKKGTYITSTNLNNTNGVNFGLEILKNSETSYYNTNSSRIDTFDSDFEIKNSYYQIDNGVTVNNLVLEPMIVKGSVTKPYLPHGCIGVRQKGLNELDTSPDEWINGYYEYSSGNIKSFRDSTARITQVECLKSVEEITYTIKLDSINAFRIDIFDDDGKFLRNLVAWYNNSPNVKTFTIPKDTNYRFIIAIKNDTKTITPSELEGLKPLLVKGTYTNDNMPLYETYHEPKIIQIDLNGNSIAKIGDIKDVLRVCRNGDVKIKKNIEKVALDNLTWEPARANTGSLYVNKTISDIKYVNINTEVGNALATDYKIHRGSGMSADDTLNFFAIDVSQISVHDTKNPTGLLYYELKEPQTIKLSSIEPIELWKETNIFELITNLDTEMKVIYNYLPAKPSLEDPSEIKKVGSNENLLDDNLILYKGNYDESGDFFENNDRAIKDFIELDAGQYILWSKNNNWIHVLIYNENKGFERDIQSGSNKKEVIFELTSKSYIRFAFNPIVDNLTDFKLEKGSKPTLPSSSGMGSGEIDVVNKNLCSIDDIVFPDGWIISDINESEVLVEQGSGKFKWTGWNNYINSLISEYKIVKYGIFSEKRENTERIFNWSDAVGKSIYFNTIYTTRKGKIENVWVANDLQLSNEKLKIIICIEDSTEYVAHQSQSIIMPVQQEMLQGDYFDFDREKEVHNWKKIILTGNEPVYIDDAYHGITQFTIHLSVSCLSIKDDTVRILSNYFKGVGWNNSWAIDNSVTIKDSNDFRFMTSQYTTVADFKLFLKSKYDEGNPVVVYYKLATPIELDFTYEQKVVAKQKKETLHTYKNVTHIFSDDEVSPIFNVKYAKDPNVKNNNLQKQIDEIKQLLSTTQTSALLLDNLQKEVESEVI